MMNQFTGYAGCSGRRNRDGQDRSGRRHPMNREGAAGCSLCGGRATPRTGNGCGCGHTAAARERSGCGCEGGRDDCHRLLEQIRAVDFALYETVLYLDVYPRSCEALETYRKLRAQSEALHAEYEASCGPLTAFGNKSDTSWDWMSKPFPWDYDAD